MLRLTESLVSSFGVLFPKDQSNNTGIKLGTAQRGQCVDTTLLPPDFGNVYVRIHGFSFTISARNIYPAKQTEHLFISAAMSV